MILMDLSMGDETWTDQEKKHVRKVEFRWLDPRSGGWRTIQSGQVKVLSGKPERQQKQQNKKQ